MIVIAIGMLLLLGGKEANAQTTGCLDIVEWARGSRNLGELLNGYCDFEGRWVPGLISLETWQRKAPTYTVGNVVWYAEGVMEETAAYMGVDLSPYMDGVALMSCSDFGETVWLRRPGMGWEGPFIVVDCAQRWDMYPIVHYVGEVAEIGFATAQRWGMVEESAEGLVIHQNFQDGVEVYKSTSRPPDTLQDDPVFYSDWWHAHATFVGGANYARMMDLNPAVTNDR